jgi:hypothetical protein
MLQARNVCATADVRIVQWQFRAPYFKLSLLLANQQLINRIENRWAMLVKPAYYDKID